MRRPSGRRRSPGSVNGGRRTADGGRRTADGGRWTVDGGRSPGAGRRWTVRRAGREGSDELEPPTGFEPVISCVAGRRLPARPRRLGLWRRRRASNPLPPGRQPGARPHELRRLGPRRRPRHTRSTGARNRTLPDGFGDRRSPSDHPQAAARRTAQEAVTSSLPVGSARRQRKQDVPSPHRATDSRPRSRWRFVDSMFVVVAMAGSLDAMPASRRGWSPHPACAPRAGTRDFRGRGPVARHDP